MMKNFCLLILFFLSSMPLAAQKDIPFAKGADISWTTELEDGGHQLYNSHGEKRECTALMKELGMNAIRLRVWVNPEKKYSSKEDMLVLAKRADSLGMALMVDFHYSDFWADPQKQNIPKAWKNMNYEEMKVALANHTCEVMRMLKENNIYPTWVQIGNETTHGMLWDVGNNHKHMNQYVGFINAGYDAVKSIFPHAICIVHLDNGFDKTLYHRVLDGLERYGGRYDMIGMSLYPTVANWNNPKMTARRAIKLCMENISELYKVYGRESMIVEVGTPQKTPDTSFGLLSSVIRKAKSNKHCRGVFYWEPESDNFNGYELGAFSNGRPTRAMDAFR